MLGPGETLGGFVSAAPCVGSRVRAELPGARSHSAQPRENEPHHPVFEQPHGLRGVKIRAQETGLCKIQCLPRAVTFRAGVAGLRPETVSHQPQERGSQRWEQVPTPGFPRGPGDSAWAGAGRAGPTLSSGSKALRGRLRGTAHSPQPDGSWGGSRASSTFQTQPLLPFPIVRLGRVTRGLLSRKDLEQCRGRSWGRERVGPALGAGRGEVGAWLSLDRDRGRSSSRIPRGWWLAWGR